MLCGCVKLCMMKVITLVKAETIAMKKEKRFYVLKSQLGFASLCLCLVNGAGLFKPITRVE